MAEIQIDSSNDFNASTEKLKAKRFKVLSRANGGSEIIQYSDMVKLKMLNDYGERTRDWLNRIGNISKLLFAIGAFLSFENAIVGGVLIGAGFSFLKSGTEHKIKFECTFKDGRVLVATTTKKKYVELQDIMYELKGTVDGEVATV